MHISSGASAGSCQAHRGVQRVNVGRMVVGRVTVGHTGREGWRRAQGKGRKMHTSSGAFI